MLTAALALGMAPQAPERSPVWLAVTRSGVRVEALERPERGARELPTPLGLFRTPSDPVEAAVDARAEAEDLRKLRQVSGWALQPWLSGASGGGFLTELCAGAAEILKGRSETEQLQVVRALESWGESLDPVPAKVPMERRVDWLWDEIRRAEPARAALLCARLVAEVQPGIAMASTAGLSVSEISRALDEDGEPLLQRAAARAAGRQHLLEIQLLERLFLQSLEGHALARDGAAEAIARISTPDARVFWTAAVFRGPEDQRLVAAWHLARYGGSEAAEALVLALSAAGRRPPERWRLREHELQVVVDRTKPRLPQREEELGVPSHDPVRDVSVVKITTVGAELAAELPRALAALTGGGSERNAAAWIEWYVQQGAKQP